MAKRKQRQEENSEKEEKISGVSEMLLSGVDEGERLNEVGQEEIVIYD